MSETIPQADECRFASTPHLLSVLAKYTTLRQAVFDTADQIVAEAKRTDVCWCGLLQELAPIEQAFAYTANEIAQGVFGLSYAALLDIWRTETCYCKTVNMAGDFPVTVDLPARAGVYVCFDQDDRVAYIGTSRNDVKARLRYAAGRADFPVLSRWTAFFPGTDSMDSAAVWEVRLIEKHQPYLNRQHTDTGNSYTPPPQDEKRSRERRFNPSPVFVDALERTDVRELEGYPVDEPWFAQHWVTKAIDELGWESLVEAIDSTRRKERRNEWSYFCAIIRNQCEGTF